MTSRRPHPLRRFLGAFVAALAFLSPGSDAAMAASAAKGDGDADAPQPFTETIPGTTVSFVMRPVPAGKVTVAGADGRAKEVEVGALWFAETEVTWDAFDIFMMRLDLPKEQRVAGGPGTDPLLLTRPSPPYGAVDRGWGHGGYPALAMTYHSARQYCKWLSEKTGRKYRLPTVAEWQHACEAGGGGGKPKGEQAADDEWERRAWLAENAGEKTHPVGKKEPNRWGLHDMAGNVAEWCGGDEQITGGKPVICGGSFLTERRPPEDEEGEEGAEGGEKPAALERVEDCCGLREAQTAEWTRNDGSLPKSKWWLADGPFVGLRVVCEDAE